MGHTYRKEKNFDDRGHQKKKVLNHDIERKQAKNRNYVIIEDDEYYDDDVEFDDIWDEEDGK